MNKLRGSYTHLLIVLVVFLVSFPLFHFDDEGLFELLSVVVLLDAVIAVSGNRRLWYLTLGAGFLAVVSNLVSYWSDTLWTTVVRNSLVPLFVIYVVVLIARSIAHRTKRVTGDTIMGAICVYLLLGWAWTFMYRTVLLVQPGAIVFPETPGAYSSDLLYFSFVTLTSLGYGDILPVSNAARTLAWTEAVVGQLYVAVTIAHLVGLRISGAMQQDTKDS